MTIQHSGRHLGLTLLPQLPQSRPVLDEEREPGEQGGEVIGSGIRGRQIRRVGRSYTRFVQLMKVLLPLLALGLLALLAAWPRLTAIEHSGIKADRGELEMMNARYLGTDRRNRPFSVTADRAIQSVTQPGLLDLVRPEAEMTLENGSWVLLRADRGRYNETTGKLLLLGNADLFHDKGYEFKTDEVHVDVNAGTAWGDRPVVGQGPFGELFAQGFRLFDQGSTIVFTGHARLNLVGAGGGQISPKPAAPQQVTQ